MSVKNYQSKPIDYEPICFIVSGCPVAKQSFKYSKNGGYAPANIRSWQDHVGYRAKEAMAGREPISGPVSMQVIFVLPDNRRVDLDNLQKLLGDALNKIVFQDDSQIVNLHLVKQVKETPGVMICIHPGEHLPGIETPGALPGGPAAFINSTD